MRLDKEHWPRCLLWHGWLPMLSGVNGASPWAVDASESASYLVEVALGRYSSGLITEWSPSDEFDEAGAASSMPDQSNVWTDGSLVLDQVIGVSRLKPGVAFCFSVVARMFAPSVGTMMDDEHAFATSTGTAWRRRQRRLRAFCRFVLWHSKMEIAAALHHTSRLRTSTTSAATQTMSFAPDPAAATHAATASFSAPATAIEFVIPSPVIEHATAAPVDRVHSTSAFVRACGARCFY